MSWAFPATLLLEQLKSAGVTKQNAADDVSEADKAALLNYLRTEHGGIPKPKSKNYSYSKTEY